MAKKLEIVIEVRAVKGDNVKTAKRTSLSFESAGEDLGKLEKWFETFKAETDKESVEDLEKEEFEGLDVGGLKKD